MKGPGERAGPAPMRNPSPTTSTKVDSFRRIEVITGVGRRRRWTDEEKARIVAESLDPATTSSAVARRYGLHASQLFVWRQQLQRRASTAETSDAPGFVPVLMAEDSRSTSRGSRPDGDRARPGRGAGRGRCRCGSTAAGARGGARPAVITVPPGVRILLAARPVDFRKGMDGLAALVQQALRADPFAGDVFIFRPKRGRPGEDPGLRRHRPGPVREEAGGRAVQLAVAGRRRGPA